MYLMDAMTETAVRARNAGMLKNPVIGIFPMMTRKLEGCPRYLFDEKSIHTAVELTLGRPKVLKEAMNHLIIPYPKLWVEWPEAGRQKLRDTFGPNDKELTTPDRPLPKRLGFLLECDETGRKGTATWVWNNHLMGEGEPPNISPISPFFDLDGDFEQDDYITKNFLAANLSSLWKDNPIQQKALQSIWNTSVHRPSEWGYSFLGHTIDSPKNVKARMSHFYADVYGEYIMIWAILLLLTSSKKVLELKPVDMGWLNKKRIKKGDVPKLDYTVVTRHLNEQLRITQQGAPLGYTRKSPRVHIVSSYLARRGKLHWVVEPYWRGSGDIISRHVKVKP
jgi:hypothetical protein